MQPLSDTGAAPSAMAREIRESADVVSQILRRRGSLAEVARRLDVGTSPLVVLCGRGSSGHAGVFLRYLMETRLHLPVSASAPSVITAFRKRLTLRNALFLVISQSGRSPDLVAATESARASGARTVAIVNAVPSPDAALPSHHFDLTPLSRSLSRNASWNHRQAAAQSEVTTTSH